MLLSHFCLSVCLREVTKRRTRGMTLGVQSVLKEYSSTRRSVVRAPVLASLVSRVAWCCSPGAIAHNHYTLCRAGELFVVAFVSLSRLTALVDARRRCAPSRSCSRASRTSIDDPRSSTIHRYPLPRCLAQVILCYPSRTGSAG